MTRRRALEVPDGWTLRQLGDVVDVDTTGVLPEEGTTYSYVGLEHIQSETGTLKGVAEVDGREIRSNKFRFDPGHVLYGKLRPYLNKVALPEIEGICSTDILPLRPKRDVHRRLVAFWLRSAPFLEYANTHATGTKMPRLGPSQFKVAPIPMPPFPVQERIVEILHRADEIRRKRQEALELADAVLASTFIRMFGNPIDNPLGFRHLPLGKVADVRAGVTKGRRLEGRKTVDVPYLRVANVQDGFLDLSEVKSIEVLPEDIERYRLEPGDVLMIEGCGNPNYLGRGCMWKGEVEDCIHQNHVFRVRADRSLLLPEYLASLLRTRYANDYFRRCAKNSSGLANINSTQVKAFEIPHAPLQLQQRFVAAVEKWEEMAARLTAARRDAGDAFKSLLNRAFTGELTAAWEVKQRAGE